MDNAGASTARVEDRFRALNFADCLLQDVHAVRDETGATVVELTLSLMSAEGWIPARLRFLRCAALRLALDFWAKDAVSDTIAETGCEGAPDRVAAVLLEQNRVRATWEPLASLLLFEVKLVAPAGSILVAAADFVLMQE